MSGKPIVCFFHEIIFAFTIFFALTSQHNDQITSVPLTYQSLDLVRRYWCFKTYCVDSRCVSIAEEPLTRDASFWISS